MKIERDARKANPERHRLRQPERLSACIDIPCLLPYIGLTFVAMITPKKSLGQNFLRDENVSRKIVDSLNIVPEDVVVEIGPGTGDFTKILLQSRATVIGIEVDPRAVEILRQRFISGFDVVHQDVLTVNLGDIAARHHRRLHVVGNIPYYITTEILFWLFDQRSFIERATLMMQHEVAKRLVAKPDTKDYGILTIFTQFYSDSRFLFKVSRNSFYPRPNVDSAVVQFDFTNQLPDVDIRLFKNVVRGTFAARRKTLRNGLKPLGFSNEQLDDIPFDLRRRPENLTLAEFVSLTALLMPSSVDSTVHLRF